MRRLVPIIFLLASSTLSAQDSTGRLSLRIDVGYALPIATQNIPMFNGFVQMNTGSSFLTQVNVSLGKGVHSEIALDYMFNKNMGMEMELHYLSGAIYSCSSINNYVYHNIAFVSTITNELSASMWSLNPSFILAIQKNKMSPFMRMGVVIGSGKIRSDVYSNEAGSGVYYIERWKFDKGYAFGLNATMGLKYNQSKKWSFNLELDMNSLSYAPKRGTMYESNFDGVDQLPFMTMRQKNISFEKSIVNDGTAPSENAPDERLLLHYPFSSVGLKIGIARTF